MDFVVGHPRSGTMLIKNLINACGEEVAQHELLPALTWSAVHEPTEYYAGRLDDRAIRNLLDIYDVRHRIETRIDSCWKLSFILRPLLARFPSAKIVHLVRDPRDNVRSCHALAYCSDLWRHPAYQSDPQRNHWLRWMPEIRRPDWAVLSDLEKNCAFWTETHRLVLEGLAGHQQVFRIRFEELGDESRLAALHDFLGLPRAPSAHLRHVKSTRINTFAEEKREVARLRGSEIASFDAWPARDRDALREICGPTARELGYDID
jgi:hypothetical protein